MENILTAVCLAVVGAIGNGIAFYRMHKKDKRRKKAILELQQRDNIQQPSSEPFTMESTPIANENGERVDINDFIELEIIERKGEIDVKKCYNKRTGQFEILYAFPETSRPANIPPINLKK